MRMSDQAIRAQTGHIEDNDLLSVILPYVYSICTCLKIVQHLVFIFSYLLILFGSFLYIESEPAPCQHHGYLFWKGSLRFALPENKLNLSHLERYVWILLAFGTSMGRRYFSNFTTFTLDIIIEGFLVWIWYSTKGNLVSTL